MVAELEQDYYDLYGKYDTREKEVIKLEEENEKYNLGMQENCVLRRRILQLESDHASDCAVHNAPAHPPGPCDCRTATPPGGKISIKITLKSPND